MAARVPLTNRLPIWLTAPGPRTFRPSPLGKATTALVYLYHLVERHRYMATTQE